MWILIAVIVIMGVIYFLDRRGKRDRFLDEETPRKHEKTAERYRDITAPEEPSQKMASLKESAKQLKKSFDDNLKTSKGNKADAFFNTAAGFAGAAMLNKMRKELEEAKEKGLINDKELKELRDDDFEDMEDQIDQFEAELFNDSVDDSFSDEDDDDTFIDPDVDEMHYYDE